MKDNIFGELLEKHVEQVEALFVNIHSQNKVLVTPEVNTSWSLYAHKEVR